MSTKAPENSQADNPNVARKPHQARRLIAAVAATAVAAGLGAAYKSLDHDDHAPGANPTDNPGNHRVHKPETKPTDGPKAIEQLPGYGQQVSAEQRKALQAATVQVARLKKIPNSTFFKESFCTGIKVIVGDKAYVATARHCVVEGLAAINEFPDMNNSQDPANDPTLNTPKIIPESLTGKMSIWTVDAKGSPDSKHPVPVTEAAAYGGPDLALLSVDAKNPAAGKFDAIPSIDYEEAMGGEPVPGAQAVLYSLTKASYKEIETTGTYLGIAPNPGLPTQKLAWVSIEGSSADKDGCYYEGSGSTAVIGGAGITGPLSTRIQPNDPGVRSRVQEEWRNQVANDLGVTLEGHDTTLCGFSTMTPAMMDKMAEFAGAQ